jgi:hypothetical protein
MLLPYISTLTTLDDARRRVSSSVEWHFPQQHCA